MDIEQLQSWADPIEHSADPEEPALTGFFMATTNGEIGRSDGLGDDTARLLVPKG